MNSCNFRDQRREAHRHNTGFRSQVQPNRRCKCTHGCHCCIHRCWSTVSQAESAAGQSSHTILGQMCLQRKARCQGSLDCRRKFPSIQTRSRTRIQDLCCQSNHGQSTACCSRRRCSPCWGSKCKYQSPLVSECRTCTGLCIPGPSSPASSWCRWEGRALRCRNHDLDSVVGRLRRRGIAAPRSRDRSSPACMCILL